jgi:outer membrane protein TolC
MLLLPSALRSAQADVSASAASPATDLRQATERAILLLPDTAANQALREQAAAQRRAARGPFVGPPVVSGDLEIGGEGFSEQEVGVSAGLRWPGEGRAARRAADLGLGAVGAALDAARLELAGNVRAGWWALASAQAVLDTERGQAQLADQEIAAVSRLVEAGVQARRDLLLAQAERSAVQARLSAAETDLATAEAAYIALAGPAPARFPPEAPARGDASIDDHPALRAALARAAAADARMTASRFGTRPRIEGRVGVRRERIDAREGFDNALLVGVGVPIGRDFGAVAEAAGARSEALRATAEADRLRSRLVAERAASGRRLEVARRAAVEAESRRAALAEALVLTERGRREGEIGYIEVLRARQSLAAAARDMAVARIAALAAISTFNQAQGVLP